MNNDIDDIRNIALSKASLAEALAEQFYEIACRQASIMRDSKNRKMAAEAETQWMLAALSLKRIKYAISLNDVVMLDWAIGCMDHFNSTPHILGFKERF